MNGGQEAALGVNRRPGVILLLDSGGYHSETDNVNYR